ncbi:MAG: hypothetical protein ABIR96_10155 [Bdellovibrionota bacterium]
MFKRSLLVGFLLLSRAVFAGTVTCTLDEAHEYWEKGTVVTIEEHRDQKMAIGKVIAGELHYEISSMDEGDELALISEGSKDGWDVRSYMGSNHDDSNFVMTLISRVPGEHEWQGVNESDEQSRREVRVSIELLVDSNLDNDGLPAWLRCESSP